jgi:hypothetical protein
VIPNMQILIAIFSQIWLFSYNHKKILLAIAHSVILTPCKTFFNQPEESQTPDLLQFETKGFSIANFFRVIFFNLQMPTHIFSHAYSTISFFFLLSLDFLPGFWADKIGINWPPYWADKPEINTNLTFFSNLNLYTSCSPFLYSI